MDIRNWGLEKVMRLPDWCFGRRYIVTASIWTQQTGYSWDISEIAYPDRGVMWEFGMNALVDSNIGNFCRVGIGDQLPATHPQFMELDPLVMGFGFQGEEPRQFGMSYMANGWRIQPRQSIRFQGRRLVIEAQLSLASPVLWTVWTVVSGIPSEIPDWLCESSV